MSWVRWMAQLVEQLEEKMKNFQLHMSLERSWNSLEGIDSGDYFNF